MKLKFGSSLALVGLMTVMAHLPNAAEAAGTEGKRCFSQIEAHLKEKYAESFLRTVGRGSGKKVLPKRQVAGIDCSAKLSAKGNRYYDCDVTTSAVLNEQGEEVGAGDQVYTLRVSQACGIIFSTLSGEE